jgi:hypothetical protein
MWISPWIGGYARIDHIHQNRKAIHLGRNDIQASRNLTWNLKMRATGCPASKEGVYVHGIADSLTGEDQRISKFSSMPNQDI